MKLKLTNKTHLWLHDNRSYQGDDCLIWPYSRLRGYGNVAIYRKMTYAHVVMCELVHGPKPSPEHQAAHSCGRGRFGCCNPRHLSWKTRSENQLDKREHGGLYRGGRRKKISDDDVRAIRLLEPYATHDELGALFGVSRQNIYMIVHHLSRKKVA